MPKPTLPTSPRYIWQHLAWPQLTFDAAALAPALEQARLEQGRLLGFLGAIGLEQANAVQHELWVQEALATAAIEGEQLNLASLRSSVAHRLALADAPGTDRSVDGLVPVHAWPARPWCWMPRRRRISGCAQRSATSTRAKARCWSACC